MKQHGTTEGNVFKEWRLWCDVTSLIPKINNAVKFAILPSTMLSILFRTLGVILNLVHLGFRPIMRTFFVII